LVFAGTVRQKLGGTLEQLDVTAGPLPQVRSDLAAYAGADVSVPVLTGSYAFRPAPEVFGRVTAGLFEPMFGGVAGEVLWLPQDSAFALGAEVAYAVQRDPDLVLGFAGYDVVTGHVSGYWDMGGGYHAQLDLGRYLAGDWGGTLTLARDFDNGWRIGAFATLTDAGFDDFRARGVRPRRHAEYSRRLGQWRGATRDCRPDAQAGAGRWRRAARSGRAAL
jgi:hypothetical protein